MKKVLFATTALIATAGVASADVTLSGSASMGIFGGDSIAATGVVTQRESQFHTDIDLTFSMSGTTDNGLSFGANIDLDETAAATAFDASTQGGETIFISGAFGTLTMGSTDGALDARTAEVPAGGGSLGGVEENAVWATNSGVDGLHGDQVARLDLSLAGATVSLSAEIDNTVAATADNTYGIGATFDMAGVTVGVGYQSGQETSTIDADATAISLAGTAGPIAYGLMYVSEDRSDWAKAETALQAGFTYTQGLWSFGGSYGTVNNSAGVDNTDISSVAVTANYDLGGGAVFKIGMNDTEVDVSGAKTDATQFDAGIAMSF